MAAAVTHRNPMIAKIHIAKKDLALTEDSYRDLLKRVAGRDSAADCTDAELHRVLAEFRRLGWDAKAKKTYSNHAYVRMIFALWTDMAPLLADPSERGLRSFVLRQTGVGAPAFLTPDQANKVIEGLKSWRKRLRAEKAA